LQGKRVRCERFGSEPRHNFERTAQRSRRCGMGHTRHVAEETPQADDEKSTVTPAADEGDDFPELRARVPPALRNISFPSAARGYERKAVDSYVNQVNRLIAELEVGRSPQAAVRHALERVGEQTKALLEQARETAEEITGSARAEAGEEIARARAEAEEITARARAAEAEAEEVVAGARAEAGEIVARARTEAGEVVARASGEAEQALSRSHAEAAERLKRLQEELAASRDQAEARIQELHAETEAVWKERQQLLDEIHAMGTRLLEVTSAAAARVSPAEALEESTSEAAALAETESATA
jgi:F0F1-type ATP synthase membrane subunit b/b'